MMFNLRTLGALPLVALLAACGNDPEAFSAAMPPVTLADHSVQQTAVGQVSNGDCGETATQLTTYHMKRGSHALKPVASGTVVTENGCAVILGAVAAVAAAKVGAGDVIASANQAAIATSEANANVNGGYKPNY
jgi:hypothetical protein